MKNTTLDEAVRTAFDEDVTPPKRKLFALKARTLQAGPDLSRREKSLVELLNEISKGLNG